MPEFSYCGLRFLRLEEPQSIREVGTVEAYALRYANLDLFSKLFAFEGLNLDWEETDNTCSIQDNQLYLNGFEGVLIFLDDDVELLMKTLAISINGIIMADIWQGDECAFYVWYEE